MKDTLSWAIPGEELEDGSKLEDWHRIETGPWHWQYDSHELIRCQPMRFGRLILVRLFGVVNRGFARRSQRRDMLERWRWNGGTTSLNLGVIWEMSDKSYKCPSAKLLSQLNRL